MASETLRDQFVVGPRLGDVILRAALEGGARHVDRAVGGDQDDGELGIAAANFAEHLDAVAVRQAHVEQHQIEGMVFELLQASFAGFRERDVEAFRGQKRFEAFANFQLRRLRREWIL